MEITEKKNLLSGIQPTSQITLGNYIGAIQQWNQLQAHFQCLFFVADLYTLTLKQPDPKILQEQIYSALATYLACGIDPEKSILFLQSHVPAHTELAWILSCFTALGELHRMTQFKEKKQKGGPFLRSGLLYYPVLMAADILLYQTHLVPVGEDQKQHLELTRNLASRMNQAYQASIFQIPEIHFPPVGARIMSLKNPNLKMSKSDPNPNSAIYLTDTPLQIRTKLKRATTDSGHEITYENTKPGIKNLIQIQAALQKISPQVIVSHYQNKQYGDLKAETAELIIEKIEPIQIRIQELLQDKPYLNKIIKKGAEKANQISQRTLNQVYEKIGWIPRKLPTLMNS